jgi:pimeloyl-ACP methyl ester carboxylesterase
MVLIHGLGGDRGTWDQIIDTLAADFTVIAPDLPGHGDSDAPAGDYSLGAHASAVRDLLIALGHHSATIIGHSLGGGIAMQFAYQFPDRVDRLVLISSGGLGPEVTPILRAATLPGASIVVAGLARLPEALTRRLFRTASLLPGLLSRPDAKPLAKGLHLLTRPGPRHGFVSTARTVIDWRGQMVSAAGHLKRLSALPVLVVWGSDDKIIPPAHHRSAVAALDSPPFLEIAGAGHYPHETAAAALLTVLRRFLTTTEPFRYDETVLRSQLTPDHETEARVIAVRPSAEHPSTPTP